MHVRSSWAKDPDISNDPNISDPHVFKENPGQALRNSCASLSKTCNIRKSYDR